MIQWKASNALLSAFIRATNPCSLPIIDGAPSVVTETHFMSDSPSLFSFSVTALYMDAPVVSPSNPISVNSSSVNFFPLKNLFQLKDGSVKTGAAAFAIAYFSIRYTAQHL